MWHRGRCCNVWHVFWCIAVSFRQSTSAWSQSRCHVTAQRLPIIVNGSTFAPRCTVLATHVLKVVLLDPFHDFFLLFLSAHCHAYHRYCNARSTVGWLVTLTHCGETAAYLFYFFFYHNLLCTTWQSWHVKVSSLHTVQRQSSPYGQTDHQTCMEV